MNNPIRYTETTRRIGFWPRRVCLRISLLTRALPLGNGRSLRKEILRILLAKFPILQVVSVYLCILFILPVCAMAGIKIGIGKAEITPPVGTPSAGYQARKGAGMEGTHDPLLAIALFIDSGDKQIALCSVDHLGFTYDMVQKITQKIHADPQLEGCEIFIGSSHTHSGGGAYLDIPIIGASLAGVYNPSITQMYVDKTCEAILTAYQHQTPAKIGIGYGKTENLSQYRGLWPENLSALNEMTVIKVTDLNDKPLVVLFNYPVHPTILKSQNRLFSADFVGYARDELQLALGVQTIYFNGAQGDIIPVILDEQDQFHACRLFAHSLTGTVKSIWEATPTTDTLHITVQKESYTFNPQATPTGLLLPVDTYSSEINLIVFNKVHAFITIPGELSCFYDTRLQKTATALGYAHLSILGLTNDAHGYIISPESWRHQTFESRLSFGGEHYGDVTEELLRGLFTRISPSANTEKRDIVSTTGL